MTIVDATDAFEERRAERAGGDSLVVDLDGYEGPLDVLLALAREQKVDVTRISILQLAEQYISFIEQARRIRLEIAAEYLVMAAWLAFLKSKLLLPEPEEDEPSGEEMAARLTFQLQRLEAMRESAEKLMARPRTGIDVFARGMPEGVTVIRNAVYECELYELLRAYANFQESKGVSEPLRLRRDLIYTVEHAVEQLRNMLGHLPDWSTLQSFLPAGLTEPFARRSATASTFAATLEMTKQGRMQLRQGSAFGPIYLKKIDKES